jgi:hypothetical protein
LLPGISEASVASKEGLTWSPRWLPWEVAIATPMIIIVERSIHTTNRPMIIVATI